MRSIVCPALILLITVGFTSAANRYRRDAHDDDGIETPEMMFNTAKAELERAKAVKRNYKVAKNLILVIGDGMGLATLTASRVYMAQYLYNSSKGEEFKMSFEDFPAVALAKTYGTDRQVTDSAATATAMVAGQKTNYGVLGVTAAVPYGNSCTELTEERKIKTILDEALAAGKSVGIVTNTRVTHATPGATYAHTNNRDWESDTDILDNKVGDCDNVDDIALDLVVNNPNINVVLGGGWRSFIPNNISKPVNASIDSHQRSDGRDLIQEWKDDKANRQLKHAYVENTEQLMAVNAAETDYFFGLFSESHMAYEADRDKTPTGQPSLTEMVEKAIQILQKNDKGYFLLVEGGRIDHAHHDSLGRQALHETVALDTAVKKIVEHTSEDDTLLIVTADHSHVFTMGGYPSRGNDILGTVDWYPPGETPQDNLPFLTLSYTNGPMGRINGTREDYGSINTRLFNFTQPADVPIQWESHGGEDVAIYSRGPMSHLFHTTHEQHYIAHVMMYSACLGSYSNDEECDRLERSQREDKELCAGVRPEISLVMVLAVVVAMFYTH